MLTILNGFDPVAFLGIDTTSMSSQEIADLKTSLSGKISEYVLLKLSDGLSKDQFQRVVDVKDPEEMAKILEGLVPDLEGKIRQELENFKSEYQQAI